MINLRWGGVHGDCVKLLDFMYLFQQVIWIIEYYWSLKTHEGEVKRSNLVHSKICSTLGKKRERREKCNKYYNKKEIKK